MQGRFDPRLHLRLLTRCPFGMCLQTAPAPISSFQRRHPMLLRALGKALPLLLGLLCQSASLVKKGASPNSIGSSSSARASPASCQSHCSASPPPLADTASGGIGRPDRAAPAVQAAADPRALPCFQSTASQRSSRSAPAPVPCTPAGSAANPTTIDALLGDWQSYTDQAVARSQQTI